jgi:hypothetical protein
VIASVTPSASLASRLGVFLPAVRQARALEPQAALVERLSPFLAAVRALQAPTPNRAPIPAKAPPEIDLERVRSMFQTVGAQLRSVAREGELLDLWSVVKLKRDEVRNASVLAWLLNPRGSHGQGTLLLETLMAQVAFKAPDWSLSAAELAAVTVETEQRPLGSSRDRVDIAIDGPGFVIFIEVKIDAPEGERQLERYHEAAAHKAASRKDSGGRPYRHLVVFLGPRTATAGVEEVVEITWRDIGRALRAASTRATGAGRVLIRSFAAHVRTFYGDSHVLP